MNRDFITSRESGVVLVVVLVMLGILMIVVVSLVSTSNINFRIAGNQQYKLEAKATARNGIETYISNPANFTLPLPTTTDVIALDLNGDGTDDMEASIPPPDCLSSSTISLSDLNFSDADDAACFGSASLQNSGILTDTSASLSGNSWCTAMLWNIEAEVDDAITNAQLTMHQGVFTRAIVGTTCP